jgi:hypothetical protein
MRPKANRKLTRKNLVVEDDKVRELARLRGTSESEAVRDAVEFALAAQQIGAAIRKLHDLGAFADDLGRLPDESEDLSAPARS